MKRVLRRLFTVLPAVLLQIFWIGFTYKFLSAYSAAIDFALIVLAVVLVMYISTKRDEGAYKILWLIIILSLPIVGVFLYVCFGDRKTARPLARKIARAEAKLPRRPDGIPCESLKQENPRLYQTVSFIAAESDSFLSPCGETTYYSLGEDMWQDMLYELREAKRYIFAEYFVVAEGDMWDSMVEIMAQKVTEGVDVRVMYDDLGSLSTYSRENVAKLRRLGIECVAFNPLFFIRGTLNNRDHRKMLIIDGKTVFSGGINMADEYINHTVRFGHWKDIGFRIKGAGVYPFTRLFCGFWNAFAPKKIPPSLLLPDRTENTESVSSVQNGYALTYFDSPVRRNAVSNELYVELLSQACESAWFYTPYLMLGDTLADSFIRAAKRGVDVRIFLPAVPDKKLVFRMTKSYYPMLLDAGVKLYEYTPGFIHAKAALFDGKVGTIGTVNLDYRSLFLHFENNTLFYDSSVLDDLKRDFLATQELCRPIYPEQLKNSLLHRMVDSILRILAPLC